MEIFKHLIIVLLNIVALTVLVHAQSQSDLGFISIDCGLLLTSGYTDEKTGIDYISDANFTDNGDSSKALNISSEYDRDTLEQPFRTVRSFPTEIRNCYTVKLTRPNVKFLIRASFMYGNYDNKRTPPRFDLLLEADVWDTIEFTNASTIVTKEILHLPQRNYVHVCLINTYSGTPFISSLELRPLNNLTYLTQSGSGSLLLHLRLDVGSNSDKPIRYKDDIYDRIWTPYTRPDWKQISTSQEVKPDSEYRQPPAVMRTAVTPADGSDCLTYSSVSACTDNAAQYRVYMHFAELQEQEQVNNQPRQLYIYASGELWNNTPYDVPRYLYSGLAYTSANLSDLDFSINKTQNSPLPPILNAIEIYREQELSQALTDQQDVEAIMSIKTEYGLIRSSWQGDPCSPKVHSWQGVKCSSEGNTSPRITSLDLSSSGISGPILPSITSLIKLESLDLSNNSLTGPVPSFLSQLAYLKVLNLDFNDLEGSVPAELTARKKAGRLMLRVEGNPDITTGKKKKKNVLPIVATVIPACNLVGTLATIWILKTRNRAAAAKAVGNLASQEYDEENVAESTEDGPNVPTTKDGPNDPMTKDGPNDPTTKDEENRGRAPSKPKPPPKGKQDNRKASPLSSTATPARSQQPKLLEKRVVSKEDLEEDNGDPLVRSIVNGRNNKTTTEVVTIGSQQPELSEERDEEDLVEDNEDPLVESIENGRDNITTSEAVAAKDIGNLASQEYSGQDDGNGDESTEDDPNDPTTKDGPNDPTTKDGPNDPTTEDEENRRRASSKSKPPPKRKQDNRKASQSSSKATPARSQQPKLLEKRVVSEEDLEEGNGDPLVGSIVNGRNNKTTTEVITIGSQQPELSEERDEEDLVEDNEDPLVESIENGRDNITTSEVTDEAIKSFEPEEENENLDEAGEDDLDSKTPTKDMGGVSSKSNLPFNKRKTPLSSKGNSFNPIRDSVAKYVSSDAATELVDSFPHGSLDKTASSLSLSVASMVPDSSLTLKTIKEGENSSNSALHSHPKIHTMSNQMANREQRLKAKEKDIMALKSHGARLGVEIDNASNKEFKMAQQEILQNQPDLNFVPSHLNKKEADNFRKKNEAASSIGHPIFEKGGDYDYFPKPNTQEDIEAEVPTVDQDAITLEGVDPSTNAYEPFALHSSSGDQYPTINEGEDIPGETLLFGSGKLQSSLFDNLELKEGEEENIRAEALPFGFKKPPSSLFGASLDVVSSSRKEPNVPSSRDKQVRKKAPLSSKGNSANQIGALLDDATKCVSSDVAAKLVDFSPSESLDKTASSAYLSTASALPDCNLALEIIKEGKNTSTSDLYSHPKIHTISNQMANIKQGLNAKGEDIMALKAHGARLGAEVNNASNKGYKMAQQEILQNRPDILSFMSSPSDKKEIDNFQKKNEAASSIGHPIFEKGGDHDHFPKPNTQEDIEVEVPTVDQDAITLEGADPSTNAYKPFALHSSSDDQYLSINEDLIGEDIPGETLLFGSDKLRSSPFDNLELKEGEEENIHAEALPFGFNKPPSSLFGASLDVVSSSHKEPNVPSSRDKQVRKKASLSSKGNSANPIGALLDDATKCVSSDAATKLVDFSPHESLEKAASSAYLNVASNIPDCSLALETTKEGKNTSTSDLYSHPKIHTMSNQMANIEQGLKAKKEDIMALKTHGARLEAEVNNASNKGYKMAQQEILQNRPDILSFMSSPSDKKEIDNFQKKNEAASSTRHPLVEKDGDFDFPKLNTQEDEELEAPSTDQDDISPEETNPPANV